MFRNAPLPFLIVLFAACAVCDAQPAARSSDEPSQPGYILQPNDEITVRSLQVKEMADKAFRLDQEGRVNLPLIGRISLSGQTVLQAEELLVTKLKIYYVQPDLELNISNLHTDTVSVIGSVGAPGVHQINPKTTLLDALSAAGGVRPDSGPVVVITREPEHGAIKQPGAHTTISGESVAEINLKSLLAAGDPTENILLQPHDRISVPAAQVVYVVGNVKRAGGFPLGGKSDLSVLQALALAEGLDLHAAPERGRILRRENGSDLQVPVNLKKILAGKAEDLTLRPNDILFVPNSATKAITSRTIEAAIQIGTGVAIFVH
jgi:polysaccharide export outer membrane protein